MECHFALALLYSPAADVHMLALALCVRAGLVTTTQYPSLAVILLSCSAVLTELSVRLILHRAALASPTEPLLDVSRAADPRPPCGCVTGASGGGTDSAASALSAAVGGSSGSGYNGNSAHTGGGDHNRRSSCAREHRHSCGGLCRLATDLPMLMSTPLLRGLT